MMVMSGKIPDKRDGQAKTGLNPAASNDAPEDMMSRDDVDMSRIHDFRGRVS
jgi:hypothetical protein